MIGDLFNMNKRKDVRTREDQVMYYGKKYRCDKRTGYYVCTTGDRKRLHVAIWENVWCRKVPAGCVIHHLDWNKTNNTIENLICLTVQEHETVHNIKGKEYGYELSKNRVDGLPGSMIK